MDDPTSPAQLAATHIRGLHAYVPGQQPGEDGWLKLNTNENPYPPSPKVMEAMALEMADSLRLYPDPRSTRLRQAFARLYGVAAKNIIVGNGSDDVLNLLVRAFGAGTGKVGFTSPSYSLYPVIVAIENGNTQTIDFDREMRLPVEKIAASDANLLFLTSPNAPTGVGFTTGEIRSLAERFKGLLVIDEAYADFANENALGLLAEFPRLVITRTLSKSHGLAGMRIGCAVGHPDVIEILDRVRDSYNVNRMSQAAGFAAIEDRSYTDGVVQRIRKTRDETLTTLKAWNWFTYPSQANFIFTEPRNPAGATGPEVAQSCFDELARARILVRHFPSHALTRSFLRITVGTDSQMRTLLDALQTWLKIA